eukprot:1162271-Rhodomonas_salina.1
MASDWFVCTAPAPLSKFFASEFIGQIDQRVVTTLTQICTTFSPATHAAPLTSILQSSGYGKSKTL